MPSLVPGLAHVPWYRREELMNVCELIKSSSHSEWNKAVQIMNRWKIRAGPRLEHAYSVTLDVLTDLVELTQRPGVASASTIHSASLTIVRIPIIRKTVLLRRFVSLISDTQPQNTASLVKTPVLEQAAKVGIPDWVVDIRHGVVHNQLPSQGLILKALHFARQFLIEKFWQAISTTDGLIGDELTDFCTKLRYEPARKQQYTSATLPTKEVCSVTALQEITQALIKAINAHTSTAMEEPTVPGPVAQFYAPLLRAMNSVSLNELVALLAEELTSEVCSDNGARTAWILHLLSDYEKRMELACIRSKLISSSVQTLSPLTLPLYTWLNDRFGEDFISGTDKLVSLYLAQSKDASPPGDVVFTVSDLPQSHNDSTTSWQTAETSINWNRIPIGATLCSGSICQGGSRLTEMTVDCNENCDEDLVMDCGDRTEYPDTENNVPFKWSQKDMEDLITNISKRVIAT